MIKSWRTTVAGILQFLSVTITQVLSLFDSDPTTNPEWGIIVASLITLIGLLTARDNGVTSEKAGAK